MVSDADRRKMERIAADLAHSESNDHGTPEQRREILEFINERRRRAGRPELVDDPADAESPEQLETE